MLNMSKRSHYTKPKQITPRSVVKDHLPLPQQAVYKNFKELCQRTSGVANELKRLEYEVDNDRFVVKMMLDSFLISEFDPFVLMMELNLLFFYFSIQLEFLVTVLI